MPRFQGVPLEESKPRFQGIPLEPPEAPSDAFAPHPKDDPVTAQVRAELLAERAQSAEEEKQRHEQFKAGETPWYEYLTPYPGKFKPLTPEQKAAEEKGQAAQSLIGQGGSIGLADEAAALLSLPGEMWKRGTLNPATGWDYAKTRQNVQLEADRQKAGGLGIAAEIGGGLGLGGGLAKAGVTFMPQVANAGWLANAAGRAKDAVAFGGAYGLGTGEGILDRLQGGAAGAVMGGLLGAPAPSVTLGAGAGGLLGGLMGGDLGTALTGAGAGALLGPFAARSGGTLARSMFNPSGVAGEAIGSALASGGRTLDDVEKGMRRATRDQVGDVWTLADETAPQTRSLLSGVAQAPSTVRDKTYQQLLDRQSGQRERLVFETERLAGDPRTARQVYAARNVERKLTNDKLFGEAREQAGRVHVDPVLDVIDEGIYLGPAPGKAAQTEDKLAAQLAAIYDNYPPPTKNSGVLYKAAYEKDLLRDIEKGYAEGLDEKAIIERLNDKLADISPQNRLQLIRKVRDTLEVPSPNDDIYSDWQIETLDRIIQMEAREKTKGFAGLPNDSIADALREARGYLSDKGSKVEKFDHAWRARQNIEAQIQRVGLEPAATVGGKQAYNPIGRELAKVRDALDEALANSSSPYRTALDEAKRGRKALAAIEKGQEMARKGRAKDNIPEYKAMSEEEKAGARSGYMSDVAGKMEASETQNQLGKVSSLKRRAELAAMAPDRRRANRFDRARDREQTMWNTFQHAFGGSQTAQRLAAQDQVPELLNPDVLGALLSGQGVTGAARNLLTKGSLWRQGFTPEVRDEILRMLTARPGGQMKGVSEQLRRSVMGAEARRRTQNEALRVLYGGGAAALTD